VLLALFLTLFQTAADGQPPPRDARPVRVWLGSSGVLIRGTPVRVYVQAAQDGNLIVLHRRTDGRIDVLFPGKPNEDPFVRAGTYEIQATPSRVAFVVAEPDGSGLVLAALAPRAYRFDEFVRAASWDADALAPSWDGSDSEGVLSDIVQRMLGDGYFNYDIATYTVAPPVYAMQQDTGAQYPMYPTCTDCTFIGFQQNGFELLTLCDPFFSPCIDDGRFHHRGRRPHEAPAAAPSRTIALSMRGSSATAVIPRDGRAAGGTGFVRKSPTPRNRPIEPRSRAPLVLPRERASLPIRAVPLGPSTVPIRGRNVSAPAEPGRGRLVSLTLTPTRVREEPAEASRNSGSLVLTGLTVSPPVQPAPSSRTLVSRREALAVQGAAPMMVRERGLAVAGSGSRAGGEAAAPVTARTQGIALPPAMFHGAQARVPATRTGVRRR
jgi:Domain of unknown function (DUF4384)